MHVIKTWYCFITLFVERNCNKWSSSYENVKKQNGNSHDSVRLLCLHGWRPPWHRSKAVKDYLTWSKITVLDWPVSNPDLIPIENLWGLSKDNVAEKQPTNTLALTEVIKYIWCNDISCDYCRSLTDSMPRRILSVITNKGGYIKYWYQWIFFF